MMLKESYQDLRVFAKIDSCYLKVDTRLKQDFVMKGMYILPISSFR